MTLIQKLYAQIAVLQARLAMLTNARPTSLHPAVAERAEKVIRDMAALGHNVMIFQGYRSFEEQDKLYAQGRTRPGAIVTNARGGDSYHNYGVAVDVVFVKDKRPSWDNAHPWDTLGKIGKSHGLEWGGDWISFPDRPHLQYTGGYTLDDFKKGRVDYKKIT